MNIFDKYLPEDLYQSYVIETNDREIIPTLVSYLKEKNLLEGNNPDILVQDYDALRMQDLDLIKSWHINTNTSNSHRVCIINTKFINHDAEHSLLKMLEEPKKNTHFFIIIPNSKNLLPTIISRVHVIKLDGNDSQDTAKEVKDFIGMSQSMRIEYVASLIKEYKDAEGSGSIRDRAIHLISGIEYVYYQEFKKNKTDIKTHFVLEQIQNARKYLNVPGCSVKMILEHIALVI